MRDILTIIASIVILVLAIAVAAPPLISWEAYRGTIDQMIARASGTQARTEGNIAIRLLPAPRIRVDRLRLGGQGSDTPSLTADHVQAEIALMPLLRREVRFTQAEVGRADIRVPVSGSGEWHLPPDLVSGSGRRREWAIDSLNVVQLLVTTHRPNTGRTNQVFAEDVHIEGQKLIGPWRIEGITAGIPFRLVTGELAEDKSIQVKLSGGGDSYPRFDLDTRLALDESGGEATTPKVSGKAKVLFGPPAQIAAAGIPIPIAVESEFETKEGAVVLGSVSLEAGEGGASLRMTGDGRIGIADPRISLRLEGRRLDADSFILSSNGQDFKTRLAAWSIPSVGVPVDLDLKIDSIGLGQEDLSHARLALSLERNRVRLEKAEFTAPGETRVALSGEFGLNAQAGLNGKVALNSQDSDRLANYLSRFKIDPAVLQVLDGRPVEASSEIAFVSPVLSFNRLRLKTSETVLTGNVRYTAQEERTRGRLDAQLAIQGLDLNELPQISNVFRATQKLDLGLVLNARQVRAGTGPASGRISARILSDGPALVVETLDIVDLAGANARVQGRIAPDGSGQIAGKVVAPRAAPLVDLLGSVWVGGISNLVPHFLREGALDVNVTAERVAPPPGSGERRLRTTVKGTAAGGPFEGTVESVDGRTENLAITLATDNTGRWVDRANAAGLKRPSRIELRGTRVGSGLFNVTMSGEIAGLQVTTNRPFALSSNDEIVDSGEAELSTSDITPFLFLLGDGAGVSPPVPASARVTLGRERDATLLDVTGQVSENAVQARLAVRSRADISGEVSVERLSLPWLTATLVFNVPGDPNATSIWSTARFGQSGRLVTGGQVTFRAGTLDLGRGLKAGRATFTVAAQPDGIAIRDFDAVIGNGRLSGSTTITRQGTLATVVGEGALQDVPLWALTGATPFEATLSGSLKFGAAGESMSELVANLGGAGEWRIARLLAPAADPSAFSRTLRRALEKDEPLAEGWAETALGEELGRAPLTASTVSTSAAVVGGILRLSPFVVETGQAIWQGAVTYDLRTLELDAHGSLVAKQAPEEWDGAPPSIGLGWQGSLETPIRKIDAGPFRNGLAAIVLKRELEKIEAFERAAAERQRQIEAQREAERQRARAAAEEAARQARQQEEAEQARREAERLQSQQQEEPQDDGAQEEDDAAEAPASSTPLPLSPPAPTGPPPLKTDNPSR